MYDDRRVKVQHIVWDEFGSLTDPLQSRSFFTYHLMDTTHIILGCSLDIVLHLNISSTYVILERKYVRNSFALSFSIYLGKGRLSSMHI